MKFTTEKPVMVIVGNRILSLKAGEYETKDEAEIKALSGAKNVSEVELEEDIELEEARKEYEELLGKKPHKNSGIDKLKQDIEDFKNQE